MTTFSFRLNEAFVDEYRNVEPDWGYVDVAGTSLSELIFLDKYSRVKEDGTKETWVDACERVINGMFTIQKDHCKDNRLPWNDNKAHRSAEKAFDLMFNFKWLPPGRGLWMMGSPLVMEQRNSAALQNCGWVSTTSMTKRDPSRPFAWLMEASMYGVGVGFDGRGAAEEYEIYEPDHTDRWTYDIPDTKEGWVESVRLLLDSYLRPNQRQVDFGYHLIRPKGAPIKTFGGVAAGPEPLSTLHAQIRTLFRRRAGEKLTTVDIADIGNMIGVCVISGNVRRSAEIFLGDIWDDAFLNLKNPERFPERMAENTGWGFMSNNSVQVNVGMDLSGIAEGIRRNGEPGVMWLDSCRNYGRFADPKNGRDYRVTGVNPCGEQPLESFEMCTLVEVYLDRCEDYAEYAEALKAAYLYAKTVTLIPTHWEETNAIMQRNRRIGTSVSGVANFLDRNGMHVLRKWLDDGYDLIQHRDRVYSDWLCVRESIKTTTVKPSGTTSLLTGSSPGVHWSPGGRYSIRRMTFDRDSDLAQRLIDAGYNWEQSVYTPGSIVVEFVIESRASRSERDVSLWEKAMLAAELQRWWSDNAVSVTLSYDPETEGGQIESILNWAPGNLKTVSFLPLGEVYKQAPWQAVDDAYMASYEAYKPSRVDLSTEYVGDVLEATGEAYCTTDTCLLPGQ